MTDKKPLSAMRLKQQRARHLFMQKGMMQKDIALKLGVTPKTISGWAKKGDWFPPIHRRARALYLQPGVTAKTVCSQLGITEKTMSKWVAKYGWKKLKQTDALMLPIRLQARALYLQPGVTARAVAGKVGITEKTIGKWAKIHGWKELKRTAIEGLAPPQPESG